MSNSKMMKEQLHSIAMPIKLGRGSPEARKSSKNMTDDEGDALGESRQNVQGAFV